MDRFFVENSFMDLLAGVATKITQFNREKFANRYKASKFAQVFFLKSFSAIYIVYAVRAVHLVAFYDLIYELVC